METNQILENKKKWGVVYTIYGLFTIVCSIYLWYFSYDGEIYVMILFPISFLSIFYFFYGIYLVFSGGYVNPIEQDSSKNKFHRIGRYILFSNLIVAPLLALIGLVLATTIYSHEWGPIFVMMYGFIIYGVYFLLTFIIYLFIGLNKYSLYLKSKSLFTIILLLSLVLYFGTFVDIQNLIRLK